MGSVLRGQELVSSSGLSNPSLEIQNKSLDHSNLHFPFILQTYTITSLGSGEPSEWYTQHLLGVSSTSLPQFSAFIHNKKHFTPDYRHFHTSSNLTDISVLILTHLLINHQPTAESVLLLVSHTFYILLFCKPQM